MVAAVKKTANGIEAAEDLKAAVAEAIAIVSQPTKKERKAAEKAEKKAKHAVGVEKKAAEKSKETKAEKKAAALGVVGKAKLAKNDPVVGKPKVGRFEVVTVALACPYCSTRFVGSDGMTMSATSTVQGIAFGKEKRGAVVTCPSCKAMVRMPKFG